MFVSFRVVTFVAKNAMSKIFYKVTLTQDERTLLLSLTKSWKHSSQKLLHALILLNCDRGEFSESPRRTNLETATFLKVGESMVEPKLRIRKFQCAMKS